MNDDLGKLNSQQCPPLGGRSRQIQRQSQGCEQIGRETTKAKQGPPPKKRSGIHMKCLGMDEICSGGAKITFWSEHGPFSLSLKDTFETTPEDSLCKRSSGKRALSLSSPLEHLLNARLWGRRCCWRERAKVSFLKRARPALDL